MGNTNCIYRGKRSCCCKKKGVISWRFDGPGRKVGEAIIEFSEYVM